MKEMSEIASALDETIEKSQKKDLKKAEEKKAARNSIRKSLSFNPGDVHNMTADSPYYNPYQATPFGYMPHDISHWRGPPDADPNVNKFHSQVRDPEGYREAMQFRNMAKSMTKVIEDTVEKGVKYPVGTVHEWQGKRYQKTGPGQWVLMHEGNAGEHPVEQDRSKRTDKIEQELKERKGGKKDEPSFDDKARAANDKARGLQKQESEMQQKEVEMQQKNQESKDNEMGFNAEELKQKTARMNKGEGRHINLSKPELDHLLKNGTYALISAGKNPNHEEDKKLDDKSVEDRHGQLQEHLNDSGYAYTKVKGHYGDVEDSFLVMVHDADKDHISQMGKELNQDSVIHSQNGSHEMIFTTGDNAGQAHKGTGHENTPDAKDLYTELRHEDGSVSKFSLNFDFDSMHDVDIKSKEGVKAFETETPENKGSGDAASQGNKKPKEGSVSNASASKKNESSGAQT